MRRRVVTGAGALLVVLATGILWALPAQALAPNGAIDQPATDGQTFSTYPVGFAVHFNDPYGVMDDVKLTVTVSGSGAPVGQIDFPGCGCPAQQNTWAFTPPANGKYTLTAVGTGEDRPPDGSSMLSATVTRTFFFSAPPAAPTGVSATPDSVTRRVSVAWAANAEPDISGYAIQRKDPNALLYKQVGAVDGATTSYTDVAVAQAPAGEYSYQLIAVRPNGDASRPPLTSPPSRPASAQVSGPPVTTTTPTTAPGSPGGPPAGPTTTVPVSRPAPALPPPLPADAGNFKALVNQAHASSVTTEPPDPGFNPRLPFKPQTTQQVVNVPDATQLASGATLGADSGEQRRRLTWEYLAGGLVLFMLAMHALYLKREVDHAAALEPIDVSLPPDPRPTSRQGVDPV
jgi:hypothetical protein